jgi:hypothetical protein
MNPVAFALRFCLALTLALTSVHLAVTRVEAGSLTWVEICEGTAVTVVALDGSGAPVAPHAPCPDCVIAAAVVLPDMLGVPLHDAAGVKFAWHGVQVAWHQGPFVKAQARGPPDLG